MAESGDGYGWIIYLIFFFFIFLVPVLKKIAEALGLVKKDTPPFRRPRAPQQKGPMREILDDVEGFFRKARAGGESKDAPGLQAKPKARPPKEYSSYDRKYRARQRELADLRQRRGEGRERGQRETARKPEPEVPEPALSEFRPLQPHIKPVLEEPEGLVVIEEPELAKEHTSLLQEVKPEQKTVQEKDESFFDVISELPEMARMIVMSEVLSPPKSMRSEVNTI